MRGIGFVERSWHQPQPMDAIRRKKLRSVAIFTLVTTLMGLAIGLLFVAMGDPPFWPPRLGAIIGASLGCSVGIFEEFLMPPMSRRFGYYRLNATRLALYIATIAGSILLANAILETVMTGVSLYEGALSYLRQDILVRDMGFAAAAALVAVAGLQLSSLHSLREVFQLLAGKYHYPEEEDRIVLFADIAQSTAIVERLSPLAASRFLRDCFSDMSEAILAWRGRVYQHLGDGVVITWPGTRRTSAERSILCFFELRRVLMARAEYYQERYHAVPRVRAGLHAGKVTVTWVGDAKRELALHGDVLHVTARLQSLCRELDVVCLVSRDWMDRVHLAESLTATDLGVRELRGRSEGVRVYSIREADG